MRKIVWLQARLSFLTVSNGVNVDMSIPQAIFERNECAWEWTKIIAHAILWWRICQSPPIRRPPSRVSFHSRLTLASILASRSVTKIIIQQFILYPKAIYILLTWHGASMHRQSPIGGRRNQIPWCRIRPTRFSIFCSIQNSVTAPVP